MGQEGPEAPAPRRLPRRGPRQDDQVGHGACDGLLWGSLLFAPIWMILSCICRFYTECLGMKLLRKRDIPEERYTNAFLGYGPEDSHFVVELTYSKPLWSK